MHSSGYTLFALRLMLSPKAPSSMAPRRISFCASISPGSGIVSPRALSFPSALVLIVLWPTSGMWLTPIPIPSSFLLQSSRLSQSTATFDGSSDLVLSWASTDLWAPSSNGYIEPPHSPVTTVVTPWVRKFMPMLFSRTVLSEWVWLSMKPGETTSPPASNASSASISLLLTLVILSPSTATFALIQGFPAPSITLPFLITRSYTRIDLQTKRIVEDI